MTHGKEETLSSRRMHNMAVKERILWGSTAQESQYPLTVLYLGRQKDFKEEKTKDKTVYVLAKVTQ